MSIRFTIKNSATPATKEGDAIVRYSGTSEPFRRRSERSCKAIGIDPKGEPRIVFETGLDEDKVQLYHWYTDEEKDIVKKAIKEMKPIIQTAYGGADVIEPTNQFFWKKERNVNILAIEDTGIDLFYDTERPSHALLYLSIAAGAFIDLVAPTKEYADRNGVPHYMVLESDANITEDDDEVTKAEAQALLVDLKKNGGKEGLYILSWCLQMDTNTMVAYSNKASETELYKYLIRYIDGKFVQKKRRNMPKLFTEYAERWNHQQTRNLLFTEAYVRAGEYYSFINQKEKKFVTSDGTVLGNTVKEAVGNLMKPKFSTDFQKLREQVEAKWNE